MPLATAGAAYVPAPRLYVQSDAPVAAFSASMIAPWPSKIRPLS